MENRSLLIDKVNRVKNDKKDRTVWCSKYVTVNNQLKHIEDNIPTTRVKEEEHKCLTVVESRGQFYVL